MNQKITHKVICQKVQSKGIERWGFSFRQSGQGKHLIKWCLFRNWSKVTGRVKQRERERRSYKCKSFEAEIVLFMKIIFMCRDTDKKYAYRFQQQFSYYLLLFERFLLVFQFKISATGFNPWVGKIPWRRKWQPLHYSCLENPMDRGAWRTTAHGVRHRHNWATFSLFFWLGELMKVF